MDAPKSLLKIIHKIKSELLEFCSQDGSKELVSLIKKQGCGFSVKSQENTYLGVVYENVYIALHRDNEQTISFSTSGNDNILESRRFKQDEKVFTRLLNDLEKIKGINV